MRKLPAAERMFICLMFHGAKNPSDAARKAGIPAKTDAALRTHASRLMHSQRIAEAMLEECRRRKKAILPAFDKALDALIADTQNKDHFKAIKLGYEQAGLIAAHETNINVNVSISQKEKLTDIRRWATELGIDAAKLLGVSSLDEYERTIDAEFTEEPRPDLSKPRCLVNPSRRAQPLRHSASSPRRSTVTSPAARSNLPRTVSMT